MIDKVLFASNQIFFFIIFFGDDASIDPGGRMR